MIDSHDYRVDLVGTGSKTGTLTAAADGLDDLDVSSPPEFGGPEGTWSPEHLLVASVVSCLMTTFRSIAANSGVEVLEYSDSSTGHLAREDDRFYAFDRITLRPRVVISKDSRIDRTERALAKAEKACLISRSLSSKVVMEPVVIQEE